LAAFSAFLAESSAAVAAAAKAVGTTTCSGRQSCPLDSQWRGHSCNDDSYACTQCGMQIGCDGPL
jgi:hypothetical protein